MALGTFVPPVRATAASYDPRTHFNRPLIVIPREFRADFTTKKFPAPKDVVFADVVDLMEAQGMGSAPGTVGQEDGVYISVIWGSGPIVDRLRGSVPTEGGEATKLPVKIVQVTPAGGGNVYYSVEPLEPDSQEMTLAQLWDTKRGHTVDEKRAALEAEAAANAPSGNGSQGSQGQAPIAGLGQTPTQTPAPAAAPAPAAPAAGVSDDDLAAAIAALG